MVAPLIPLGIQAGRILIPKALKYAGKAYSAYYYGTAVQSAIKGDYQPLTDAASFKLLNKAPKLLMADVGVIVSKGLGRAGKGPVKIKYPKKQTVDSSTVFDRAGARKIKPNEAVFKYSTKKRKQVIGHVVNKDGVYTDRAGNIPTHGKNMQGQGSNIKAFELDSSGRIKTGGTHIRHEGKDYQNTVKNYKAGAYKPKVHPVISTSKKSPQDVQSENLELNLIAQSTVTKLKKLGDKNNRLIVTKGDKSSIHMAGRIKGLADQQGVNTTIVKNPIGVKAGKSLSVKRGDNKEYKIEQFNRESSADHASKVPMANLKPNKITGVVGSRLKFFKGKSQKEVNKIVAEKLDKRGPYKEIVSGESPGYGVDQAAKVYARSKGIKFTAQKPKAKTRDAFIARNQDIVNKSEQIIAIRMGKTPGTSNTISRTKHANKPYEIIDLEKGKNIRHSKFNPVREEQMDMIRKRSTVGAVFKSKARNRFIVPIRDIVRDVKTKDGMLIKTPASATKSYFNYLEKRLGKNISGPAFGDKNKHYVVGSRTIDKLSPTISKTSPNKVKRFSKTVEQDAMDSVGKGTRKHSGASKKYPNKYLDNVFRGNIKLKKNDLTRSVKADKSYKASPEDYMKEFKKLAKLLSKRKK